jgi:hypothetical protein
MGKGNYGEEKEGRLSEILLTKKLTHKYIPTTENNTLIVIIHLTEKK